MSAVWVWCCVSGIFPLRQKNDFKNIFAGISKCICRDLKMYLLGSQNVFVSISICRDLTGGDSKRWVSKFGTRLSSEPRSSSWTGKTDRSGAGPHSQVRQTDHMSCFIFTKGVFFCELHVKLNGGDEKCWICFRGHFKLWHWCHQRKVDSLVWPEFQNICDILIDL